MSTKPQATDVVVLRSLALLLRSPCRARSRRSRLRRRPGSLRFATNSTFGMMRRCDGRHLCDQAGRKERRRTHSRVCPPCGSKLRVFYGKSRSGAALPREPLAFIQIQCNWFNIRPASICCDLNVVLFCLVAVCLHISVPFNCAVT